MELNEHTTSIGKLAILFLALLLFAIWLAYDASAALNDAVIYYTMDDADTNATTTLDSSASSNHATLSGVTSGEDAICGAKADEHNSSSMGMLVTCPDCIKKNDYEVGKCIK